MKNKNAPVKNIFTKISLSIRLFCFALGLTAMLTLSCAAADPVIADKHLPYAVPFELGSSAFAPGDNITIKEVRGTSDKIVIGGTYSVSGAYTLSSRDEANLSFFDTSVGYSGPTPTDPKQTMRIKRGTGLFYLVETMHDDGYLHVSFYDGPDFGGVYFGQGDRVFHGEMRLNSDNDRMIGNSRNESVSASGPNEALFNYLGNPVAAPANMDPRYTATGLTDAVLLAARNAGITVKNVAVDDSEFPFLVGVICGGSDCARLKSELRKMPGYQYGGGVGDDSHADGSDTCNVFCIVPHRAFPEDAMDQIYHRMMLREEVFYDQLNNQQQVLVPTHAQSKLPTMPIYLGGQTLDAELALTEKEQIIGMMFRTNIQETDSMLFVLPSPQRASFWMKNCPESLSAAYISSYGTIEEIHHLEQNDTTPVVSSNENIQFVLETKDGWFERHNVDIGTTVSTAKGTLSETFPSETQ
ncbi:MAG TPA: DUF192 domain-containing protein [Candidatus Sulfotelmatobacter sp.]|nr:DUF192 domain-containing protein [Candidatus Sulfotelmatobacter sp.]